ncbi:alanine--tRNA ligase [Desulfuribacillus stibiiarsenatis]|uniref:Alanine--tRNA ligase n=1 Tax=Desulfuribacillus stibiiarsenatis TaxID=1390249 RepID=A0A1E5L3D2_9FIRM|nr:alanine--tRNA ligase [Desulfuribacillus stibiiarsenatis]OEH84594.1 alanine--tRNA ligase [Desulfuribacillus stibiiarsenatis]
MKSLKAKEVRKRYLEFFASKGHEIVPSAPLVPIDDPTLLWINCGMAPLKKYFDGREIPENPRIANSQKSIRTNDIENVGRTARHHTFFEMLGNFSIGDYFKRESIHWAWEFLTKEMELDIERLSVTIHPEDEEAFDIWHQELGVPKERIIRLTDNFWDIGEGPCGPNSEIFFDRGESFSCGDPECKAGCDCERYLEIWNLVFSQYNHNKDGSYTPLPKKNIDTGMGLERMASVLQQVDTNYETDLLRPIIDHAAMLANKQYKVQREFDIAFNVIADHARTVTFAVSEGVLPSNEGRGYVIRRLLRRAVRFGKVLGFQEAFLYKLAPVVADIMEDYYPEIKTKLDFVQKVIRTEEDRFRETLNDGLVILQNMIDDFKTKGVSVIGGQDAFKLYDTYGFPVDLTEDLAEENGFTVDKEGFETYMQEQRERARNARQDENSMNVQGGDLAEFKEASEFVGYSNLNTDSSVLGLFINREKTNFASVDQECQIILDRTPFYAESGGQAADVGYIKGKDGVGKVVDVQKGPNGQHVHKVFIEQGTIQLNESVVATVDGEHRKQIIKNHTATHILHKALKEVLGDHVNQAGSQVSSDRLRFDFSHLSAVTQEELRRIERIVNEQIWESTQVNCQITDIETAKQKGATALFGEKYGNEVRVVSVGDYSMELCGGCHVDNTAEIGLFKIASEYGIGAGIRRIEAFTSKKAFSFFDEKYTMMEDIANQLKTKVDDMPKRVSQVLDELRSAQKENESLKGKLSHYEASGLIDQIQDVNGVPILAQVIENVDMDELRIVVDELKQKVTSGVILLGSTKQDKVSLVAYVTKDFIAKGVHAGNLIKEIATICGGGGGGRPDMAQAGGKDPSKLSAAIEKVSEVVLGQIK